MKKKSVFILALLLCVGIMLSGCDYSTLTGNDTRAVEYKIADGEATVISVVNSASVTEIVIPDEYEGVPVTAIADFSVTNLEYVTSVKIGKNVKEIGPWALTNNQQMTAYTVDEANESYCSVDGVIFTKDMKALVSYPAAKDVTETTDSNGNTVRQSQYVIPEGVETVCTKAFYKCGVIVTLTIPDSVKTIEEKAFFRCGALTDIQLPSQLEHIGKDAFAYCYGLTEIVIPKAVTQIDEYAFYNCSNLLSITVENAEGDVTVGEKWYPTNNGLDIDGLSISWE